MTFTTSQRYQGGIACRDGHAARFERETGRPVFLPVTVFSPGKEGGLMTN